MGSYVGGGVGWAVGTGGVGAGVGFGVGQGSLWHTCASMMSCGQAAPPFMALMTGSRQRSWSPSPHVTLQGVHADQSPSAQSTGQACRLQSRVSDSWPQGVPSPALGWATVRVRDCEPPSQDAVHVVKGNQ